MCSKVKKIDNSTLYAGSLMLFIVLTVIEIVVPKIYLTKSDLCVECTKLKELEWLIG